MRGILGLSRPERVARTPLASPEVRIRVWRAWLLASARTGSPVTVSPEGARDIAELLDREP